MGKRIAVSLLFALCLNGAAIAMDQPSESQSPPVGEKNVASSAGAEAPVIFHDPVSNATDASKLVLDAKAVASEGDATVKIGYRRAGDKGYLVEKMATGSENHFVFHMPVEMLRQDGLEYYLEASGPGGGKAFSGTPDAPHYVTIIRILPFSEGKIIERKKDKDGKPAPGVVINIGTVQGLKKGDLLVVFRDTDQVKDPDSGELLQINQVVTGRIKIVSPGPRSSTADVSDEMKGEKIEERQLVRRVCGKVTGLRVSPPRVREAEISWNQSPEPEVTGYAIYRSQSPQGPFTLVRNMGGRDGTSFRDTDLTDQATYYYAVAAVNDLRLEGEKSATVMTTTKGGPPSPKGFRAESGQVRQVGFNWAKMDDPDLSGYSIQRADSPEGNFGEVLRVKGGSETQTTLRPSSGIALEDGKKYFYRIAGFNKVGVVGNPSSSVEAATHEKPMPPEGLKVAREYVRSIGLAWTASADKEADGYAIYRRREGESAFKRVSEVSGRNAGAFIDQSRELQDAATYEYAITVYLKGNVESDLTPSVKGTTFGPPPPPASLVATNGRLKEVDLTWVAASGEEVAGYEIVRSDDGEKFSPIKKISGKEKTEYADRSKLEDGRSYHYKVASYNIVDVRSVFTEVVRGTTKPVPERPAGFSGTSGGARQTVLSWQANREQDIKEYLLFRSGKPDKGFSSIAKVKGETYSDKKLEDGTSYYYRLSAVDADGLESPQSDTVAINTKPLPDAPGTLRGEGASGLVKLSCERSATADVVKYNVYLKGFFGGSLVASTEGASIEITKDIKADKGYTFFVTAVDSTDLESKPSQKVEVKTPKE